MNCIKVIYTSYNEKGELIGSTFPISIFFKIDISDIDFTDLPRIYHNQFLSEGWCRSYHRPSYYVFDLDNPRVKNHILFTELHSFIVSYLRNKIIDELNTSKI